MFIKGQCSLVHWLSCVYTYVIVYKHFKLKSRYVNRVNCVLVRWIFFWKVNDRTMSPSWKFILWFLPYHALWLLNLMLKIQNSWNCGFKGRLRFRKRHEPLIFSDWQKKKKMYDTVWIIKSAYIFFFFLNYVVLWTRAPICQCFFLESAYFAPFSFAAFYVHLRIFSMLKFFILLVLTCLNW